MYGNRVRLWALALATTGLLACGGDSGPTTPSVEDRWSGTFTDGAATITLTLTLTETDGVVTGSGNMNSSTFALAVETEGTYVPPTVSLNITAEGFQNLNFTGTVEESVIRGRLNGSGFVNTLVVLDRQ